MAPTIALLCLLLLEGVSAQIAVVRPFATDEESSVLLRSFQRWNTVRPCQEGTGTPIDLFILYSRRFEDNKKAAGVVAELTVAHAAKSEPWHRCFRKVEVLSAGLDISEDIYDPKHSDDNANWVRGPNAVFRFLLRKFLGWEYKAFFLMEEDALATKPNWLGQLEKEVADHPSAAIRGSAYRGDRWDKYRLHLDEALLKHVNGNAIYFAHNAFLSWLSSQLHQEAETSLSAIPYDLRIAQLVMDAQSGRNEDGAELWKPGAYDGDSKLIGNYANTLLNTSFDGGEYITHNSLANWFGQLKLADLTLGVVYLNPEGASAFEESVTANHPFGKIIALQYEDMEEEEAGEQLGAPQVARLSAKFPRTRSLCEVAHLATTKYFLMMDSNQRLQPAVSVLAKGLKPVLPHLPADSALCKSRKTCEVGLARARRVFQASLDRHYELQDTVFVTDTARDFCSSPHLSSPEMAHRPPSADDYIAWQMSKGRPVSQEYYEVDREARGWRRWTQVHHRSPPESEQARELSADDNETNTTNASCTELPGDQTCTDNVRCELTNMGVCRDAAFFDLSSLKSQLDGVDSAEEAAAFFSTTGQQIAADLLNAVKDDPAIDQTIRDQAVVDILLEIVFSFSSDVAGQYTAGEADQCNFLKGARSVLCTGLPSCAFPFPAPFNGYSACQNRRLAATTFLAAAQTGSEPGRILQSGSSFTATIQVANANQLENVVTPAQANFAQAAATAGSVGAPPPVSVTSTATQAIITVKVKQLPPASSMQAVTERLALAATTVENTIKQQYPNATVAVDRCGDRTCNGRGMCTPSTGVCACTPAGFTGINCETVTDTTTLQQSGQTTIMVVESGTPRATSSWLMAMSSLVLAAVGMLPL